ncbi:MAG: DNA-processing protein DprA [Candidatus Hydrogenedentota bacterium]
MLDLLALNSLELSSIKLARLLARYGSARDVLDSACGGDVDDGTIAGARRNAAAELRLAEKEGIRILTRGDDSYPAPLREAFDAPPVLYCLGSLDRIPAVSIVGSRKADAYGLTTAEQFGHGLAEKGILVVSGLAYGIDAAAHRGALSAKGATVAVLGSGLLNIYPAENRRLAQRIVAERGALLSEFPLREKPHQKNFPRRNRIIAGLSLGTVVIQATVKSGSLITAKLAAEYGRNVWAVPNRIGDRLSEGTLALLRDGATIAASAEHIMEDLSPQLVNSFFNPVTGIKPETGKPVVTVSDIVLESLRPSGATLDELEERCGLPREELLRRILKLELAGRLTYHPGGAYRLAGS